MRGRYWSLLLSEEVAVDRKIEATMYYIRVCLSMDVGRRCAISIGMMGRSNMRFVHENRRCCRRVKWARGKCTLASGRITYDLEERMAFLYLDKFSMRYDTDIYMTISNIQSHANSALCHIYIYIYIRVCTRSSCIVDRSNRCKYR